MQKAKETGAENEELRKIFSFAYFLNTTVVCYVDAG